MSEILIPAPLPHQQPVVDSSARFKVVRAGRRGGKTVLAEYCAVVGHGPAECFPGIVSGLDVVWCARDHTQSRIMWHEFIQPRFKGVDGVTVNEVERRVTLRGGGTLFVVSAENINSVRGMGQNLAGVIVEEAAHQALGGALRDVLMPALADRSGWLLLISTTNAASDGGTDEYGQPQLPSYFNVLCEDIRAGRRSADWAEFSFTAEDNPKISADSFAALVAEYAPGSPSLEQEVYAKLLRAGVGLALPELTAERHLVPAFRVPSHWTQFGGMDWGFNHPWAFGWYACDEDGDIVLVDTFTSRGDVPAEIAEKILTFCPAAKDRHFIIHGSPDMWDEKGRAVGYKGPTIWETLTSYGLKLLKADNRRVLGLDNLRAYLHVPEPKTVHGETVPIAPRFTMMDTPGNRACLATMQAMQIDPKNLEDALKVDADHQGRGGDDMYDAVRYALMSRPLVARPLPRVYGEEEGKSLGYDFEKQRPRVRITAEEEIDRVLRNAQTYPTAGRYRVPVRRG